MIFYFTATGNSRLVASELAHLLQQEAYDLTAVLPDTFHHNETVGIVCPVHAWGVPSIMPALLQKICLPLQRADYIYVILCCGDDIGYADNHIRKMLASIDVVPDALFSMCMPNTYVALPGFDVDTLSQQQHKLENARKRIENIATIVEDRRVTTNVVRGRMAHFKSGPLHWAFNRFLIEDSYFRVNKTACTQCKRCAAACPLGNIRLQPYPTWNHHCLTCFACYHVCPHHAINFRLSGGKKGQYHTPKSL